MNSAYVSVAMPTYNQKMYVAEAIENVLQQKTTFPFELVIGEDGSTDGTKDIVLWYQKKYPEIIRVTTTDINVGARENNRRIINLAQGKYIAFCDGDDCWHDSHKLQKQVDFLDRHPDYGLVHTDFNKLKVAKGRLIRDFQKRSKKKIPQGRVYNELLRGTFISTSTVCLRRELVEKWQQDEEFSDLRFVQRDYSKWLFAAWHTKVGYLSDSTTTKRELRQSMSHSIDMKKKYDYYSSLHEIKKTYMNRFPCSQEIEEEVELSFHKQRLRLAYLSNNFQSAKESYFFLYSKRFPSFKDLFYLLGSFVKSFPFSFSKTRIM